MILMIKIGIIDLCTGIRMGRTNEPKQLIIAIWRLIMATNLPKKDYQY